LALSIVGFLSMAIAFDCVFHHFTDFSSLQCEDSKANLVIAIAAAVLSIIIAIILIITLR